MCFFWDFAQPCSCLTGEHQMELLDFVAAKFHEEGGVFKLLVGEDRLCVLIFVSPCCGPVPFLSMFHTCLSFTPSAGPALSSDSSLPQGRSGTEPRALSTHPNHFLPQDPKCLGTALLTPQARRQASSVCFFTLFISGLLFPSVSHPPSSSQIIDSIMALFRVDFSGRGELAERQQKLAQMLSRLQKISEGHLQLIPGHLQRIRSDNMLREPFDIASNTQYSQNPLFPLTPSGTGKRKTLARHWNIFT